MSPRRRRYKTLGSFYRARPAREISRKLDYGVGWLHGPAYCAPGRPQPPWRVTYAYATGELFATPLSGRGPVLVLAELASSHAADRALAGWDDPELTGWQFAWVVNRVMPAVSTGATVS